MHPGSLRRILLLACAFTPAAACAQLLPVDRPELHVGDRWKIERKDPYSKAVQATTEVVVKSVASDSIVETFNNVDGAVTPDLTVLEHDRVKYDVGYQLLRFPLEAGKKWDFKTKFKSKTSGSAGSSAFAVEVIGEEKVQVAAGTFDAVKLQAKGDMYMNGGRWSVVMTYWYAPQAKRLVRVEWRDNKRDQDFVEDLVEFQLGN